MYRKTLLSLTYVNFLRRTDLQHYTFYDFIVNKARGKSGPLFNFDVHEDVRLMQDVTVEKDEVSDMIVSWLISSRTLAKWSKGLGTTDSNM